MTQKCSICDTAFYRQTEVDPPEPCWCGACCSESFWTDYGWHGLWVWLCVRLYMAPNSLATLLSTQVTGRFEL